MADQGIDDCSKKTTVNQIDHIENIGLVNDNGTADDDPFNSYFVLLQIWTQLLPLNIDKKALSADSFFALSATVQELESVLLDIVKNIQKFLINT